MGGKGNEVGRTKLGNPSSRGCQSKKGWEEEEQLNYRVEREEPAGAGSLELKLVRGRISSNYVGMRFPSASQF